MKVLVTGAAGFLGRQLIDQLLSRNMQVIATSRKRGLQLRDPNSLFEYHKLDFTDPFEVHDLFEKVEPGIVIHAGAMTRVDDCEEQQWLAYQTNVEGTLNLLMNARERKSFFLFVSTDFVFDGEKGSYIETDERSPVNFYGKTKMEAEDAVIEYDFEWSIVRTSLVYGKPEPGKSNIISVVKENLEKNQSYNIVIDQFRTPTHVEDLASGICKIIEKRAVGIYHISGKDVMSPYEMGTMAASFLEADVNLLKKVTAMEFSQPAKRPPRTNLIIEKARIELGYEPLSFKEGLRKTLS